ncbi:MAG: alpha/beta fold hydrolase [Treponema sp.]|nr:alpha/beta fold hydrolase [Treponema sp.]
MSVRETARQEHIPLAYPVVFVHGVGAHDRAGGRKAWGRIPETLARMGVRVFLGNTDSWGDFESNAAVLKKTVEKALAETGKEKVNIIGHSKGGLDSRYLIWKYGFGGKVASLTTVCTPHHGSEIADMLYNQKITHTKFAKSVLAAYGALYGDANPDLYTVNHLLTTAKMKAFNGSVIPDGRVFYQSLYVTMDHALDDIRFFFWYLFLKRARGKSDGVVSEYSARWGDNIAQIEGGISHSEILDVKRKKISGVDIPDVYVKIVKGLSERGF